MKVLGKDELSGFECEVGESSAGGSVHGAIKVEAVPDSMFEIPPGYVETGIPGMDQMPPGVPNLPDDE